MRFIIYCTFPLLLSCSGRKFNSQHFNFDNFQDYSYLLFLGKKHAQSNSINGIGTGFFIREDNKLYLVSAEHVLTGNDPFRVIRVDSLSPDFLVFYYNKTNDSDKGFENLLLDSIKKTHPPRKIEDHADLITYPINLPANAQIKSIEGTISPSTELNVGDSVFFWGFPKVKAQPDSNTMYYYQNPHPIKYNGVVVGLNDSLYYASIPDTKQGASGSPVFVKKIIKGRDRFYFVGVLCAGSELSEMAFFVKYKQVLRLINYGQ